MQKNSTNIELAKKIDRLKFLRESVSLELTDMSKRTKIPTQTLKDIESKKFENLPPSPIGRSFINQYEKHVESYFKDTEFEVIS